MAAATPRETLDANVTRIADDLIGLRETVEKMDHAQDALLGLLSHAFRRFAQL